MPKNAAAPTAAAGGPATLPERGDPSDAVQLVLFPGKIGTAINPSPFSTKLLAFVRMGGVEYEQVKAAITDNRNPRKLWPYMMHGDNIIPDSSDTADYLAATYPATAGSMFPSDPKQLGLAHCLSRMCDEAMFPILLYYRFFGPQNRPYTEQAYFGRLPWLIRKLVIRRVWPRMEARLYLQGIGRRSEPDLLQMLKKDFASAAALIGDGPYLLGKKPCFADATLFGMIDTALWDGAPNACVRDAVREHPNLVAFAERIRAEYFKEFGAGGVGKL